MLIEFKQKFMNDYVNDSTYKHIFKIFDVINGEGVAKLSFLREYEFIFRLDFVMSDYLKGNT